MEVGVVVAAVDEEREQTLVSLLFSANTFL